MPRVGGFVVRKLNQDADRDTALAGLFDESW